MTGHASVESGDPEQQQHRHSREGGNPVTFVPLRKKQSPWIPAFAGMTA
jgi:hypothetical protein